MTCLIRLLPATAYTLEVSIATAQFDIATNRSIVAVSPQGAPLATTYPAGTSGKPGSFGGGGGRGAYLLLPALRCAADHAYTGTSGAPGSPGEGFNGGAGGAGGRPTQTIPGCPANTGGGLGEGAPQVAFSTLLAEAKPAVPAA
ncbi:hypothetical protein GCM10010315_27270 [Streptomyces luteosporeus]|uniref:Collagen-like protein n=1 Tax=Streptomyces luteosporeus TaxID=173856 RepID=A0ABN3TS71_9ACTN